MLKRMAVPALCATLGLFLALPGYVAGHELQSGATTHIASVPGAPLPDPWEIASVPGAPLPDPWEIASVPGAPLPDPWEIASVPGAPLPDPWE